ncbi:SDR family NAD(P)-dependent oxidoreductase [Actinokineospora iranica]|uniref:Short-chain dehydrogenase n=1 Tax=Actinokineospora iranica TaxID=1271860 RepID=A0A1G6LNH3_9PSEU|nr:SDR family NAD(P)-dependent oxidoreductase [Actinokineospora iranica]SDC44729.1 Short-chain dehydrogenase [Actinokineospora iranica]
MSRVAVVTGANRGIGFAVARALAARGDTVVLGSRDIERGRAAAARITGRVLPRALDVTGDPRGLVAELADEVGRVDVLVNNAAIHYDTGQRPSTADLEIVEEAWRTNALGAWACTQAFLPLLRRARSARVVMVSSEGGSLAGMGASTPAYAVTKAALNAITRSFAADLAGEGILVNAVCPGWVATDMGGPGGGPVESGAASVLWAADLPDNGPTGGFFRHGEPLPW